MLTYMMEVYVADGGHRIPLGAGNQILDVAEVAGMEHQETRLLSYSCIGLRRIRLE